MDLVRIMEQPAYPPPVPLCIATPLYYAIVQRVDPYQGDIDEVREALQEIFDDNEL